MTLVLVLGLLGGLGAVARFLLDAFVSARAGAVFPAGTLVVNLTGAFVLGLLVGAALDGDALVLAGTGLIGSYTTFSTWMLESHRLGEDGAMRAVLLNVGLSLSAGLAAVWLGRVIGELL
ncbi:MAG: fluoride efflux transporter CrcB [Thermoleophilaceae bacterium]